MKKIAVCVAGLFLASSAWAAQVIEWNYNGQARALGSGCMKKPGRSGDTDFISAGNEMSVIFSRLILVGIAWTVHRRSVNASDFLIGNRNVNFWITALSAHASDMSSWLFLGFPVAIYLHGFSEVWAAVGLFLGMAATWIFIAPRIREMTEKSGSVTLSHFFSHTVGDQSRLITITAALASLFFFVFYVASGLKGMSALLYSLFDVHPTLGLFLSALLVITYTIVGGFLTVAITDAFQAIFLLLVILIVPVVSLFSIESSRPISETLSISMGTVSWIDALTVSLGWGLGYFGMPHVLSKFMAIRKVSDVKKSMRVGLTWQFLALTASASIGIIGRIMYPEGVQGEELFIRMVFDNIPLIFCGFIMCGVVAATLSTIDSQVIVSATVICKDLIDPKEASKQILWTRLGIICVTSIAAFIALVNPQSLFEIVRYAWSGQGSTFGPIVICCLFYPRIQKWSAFVGMLTGALIAALWPITDLPLKNASLIPGFTGGILVILIGSFLEQTLRRKQATL